MTVLFSQEMSNAINHYCKPENASRPLPKTPLAAPQLQTNALGNVVINEEQAIAWLNRVPERDEVLAELNQTVSDFKKFVEELKARKNLGGLSIEQAMLLQSADVDLIPKLEHMLQSASTLTTTQLIQASVLVKYATSILENPSDIKEQAILAGIITRMNGKRDVNRVVLGVALMAFTTFCIIAALAFVAIGIAAALTGGGVLLTVATIGFSLTIVPPLKNLIHSLMHKNDFDYDKTRSLFSMGYQQIKEDKKLAKFLYFPEGAAAAQGFFATVKDMKNSAPKENSKSVLKK